MLNNFGGEDVIWADKVALSPWGALLFWRGNFLLLTPNRLLIEGLPAIPLSSITRCELRYYWLAKPYIHLEFDVDQGQYQEVDLYDRRRRLHIESLYRAIMSAKEGLRRNASEVRLLSGQAYSS